MQFFQDEHFSWKVLAVESVVIMLSVVLGFWLNGWREAQGEQETVDAALRGVAVEVQRNRSVLQNRIPYWRGVAADLDSVLSNDQMTEEDFEMGSLPAWNGPHLPVLSASSYQAASSAGAFSNMDFELSQRISSVYSFQELYLTFIVDRFFTAMLNESIDSPDEFRGALGAWIAEGQNLNRGYAELLDMLSERGITEAQSDSASTAP